MNAKQKSAGLRPFQTGSSDDMSLGTFVLSAVAIILLVAAYFQPFHWYQEHSQKAKMQSAKLQIQASFATVLEDFRRVVGRYPRMDEGLRVLTTKGTDCGPAIQKIPRDPWGNEYQYVCPGEHNVDSYDLYSFGPDGKPGDDDITNWEKDILR